jgi:hypothetical protein
MAATKKVRIRLIWAALACLVSQSGCAHYTDWIWKTSGARPSLSASDPVTEQVNNVNWLHADIFGIRKGLIDPDQPH